jgi:hypothetical protein
MTRGEQEYDYNAIPTKKALRLESFAAVLIADPRPARI